MTNNSHQSLSHRLERSILECSEWNSTLLDLASEHSCNHVHLVAFDRQLSVVGGYIASSIYNKSESSDCHVEYANFADVDFRVPLTPDLPEGELVDQVSWFKEQKIKSSTIYNEYLVKHHALEQDLVRVRIPDNRQLLFSFVRKAKLSARARSKSLESLRVLVPVLRDTYIARCELEQVSLVASTLNRLVEQAEIGVVYLDRRNFIVEANDYALQIIREGTAITDVGKTLTAVSKVANLRLQEILAQTTDTRSETRPDCPQLLVPRTDGNLPYRITIVSIGGLSVRYGKRYATMVLIRAPRQALRFSSGLFQEQFNLTKTEAELSGAISAGQTLGQYAARRAITVNTARWTLHNVFAKTGTASQAKLKSLTMAFSE